MGSSFVSVFQRPGAPAARGKYLSRVFGIFSEEIVRLWASDSRCPYENLGRPTVRKRGERLGSTLDFTLRHRSTSKVYVAELKCEIEYQNYRYLVLSDVAQLAHHNKAAFLALLDVASRKQDRQTFVHRKEIQPDGAILIWGAATPEGREAVIRAYGFSDVLTMSDITRDLREWGNVPYRELLTMRRAWANEMFDALIPSAEPGGA